jgi:hypothetical protein
MIRIRCQAGSALVIIGPWQCKVCWRPGSGRYGSGSRWFSGWYRSEPDPF